MSDTTHLCIWHDSFTYLTRVIYTSDMSHLYIWHESFIYLVRLIYISDTTHLHIWHESSHISRRSRRSGRGQQLDNIRSASSPFTRVGNVTQSPWSDGWGPLRRGPDVCRSFLISFVAGFLCCPDGLREWSLWCKVFYLGDRAPRRGPHVCGLLFPFCRCVLVVVTKFGAITALHAKSLRKARMDASP